MKVELKLYSKAQTMLPLIFFIILQGPNLFGCVTLGRITFIKKQAKIYLKGLSHEMNLAFEDIHSQF